MRRLFIILFLALSLWPASGSLSELRAPAATTAEAKKEELVSFNTKTLKYHCRTCSSARACTKNCIEITLEDAKNRGGVACKRCGGHC